MSLGRRGEVVHLLRLAVPFSLSTVSRTLHQFTDNAVLGHYGTSELAAASVANIWMGLADVPMYAAVGQMSTVCGEAYGAGSFELVGTWLKIMLVMILIASVPLLVARWFTAEILTACGFNSGLSAQAGLYARWLQVSSILDLTYYALREYMAVQDITVPAMINDAVFVLLNLLLNLIFVFNLGLGLMGSALATTFTRMGLCISFFIYCFGCRKHHKRTWRSTCKDVCVRHRWTTFLCLVLPAALGTLAEELQFQLMGVLAGRLSEDIIAAHNLMIMILMVCWTFADGLGQATGIRVANFLGAGEPYLAKRVCNLSMLITLAMGLFIGFLLVVFGTYLDYLMTTDEAVMEQMRSMRFIVALVIASLLNFSIIYTVLLKQGRGSIPSAVIPVCCWFIGCPISFYLTLARHMGLVGLWLGLLTGYSLALIILLLLLLQSDWEAIAQRSRTRAEAETTTADGDRALTSLQEM